MLRSDNLIAESVSGQSDCGEGEEWRAEGWRRRRRSCVMLNGRACARAVPLANDLHAPYGKKKIGLSSSVRSLFRYLENITITMSIVNMTFSSK